MEQNLKNKMTRKKSALDQIVSIVSSDSGPNINLYVATGDGEYGHFVIPNVSGTISPRELGFVKLSQEEYLTITQNIIGRKELNTHYATKTRRGN